MESAVKTEYVYQGLAVGLSIIAIGAIIMVVRKKSGPEKDKQSKVDLSKFDSPDQVNSGNCMDKTFIAMLQKVQQKTGFPIFDWINSGARTAYWNSKVGGVSNSSHKIPTCKAADIKAPTIAIRNAIIRAAREAGFKRIGIARTFVHLDNDDTKAQYVAWGYPSGTKPPFNPFA